MAPRPLLLALALLSRSAAALPNGLGKTPCATSSLLPSQATHPTIDLRPGGGAWLRRWQAARVVQLELLRLGHQ